MEIQVNSPSVPIIVDVARNIDEMLMVRCAYYCIQSDGPITEWNFRINQDASLFVLNLEAILTGPPGPPDNFRDADDLVAMYSSVEEEEGLYVDINDIWVPAHWFGKENIKEGQVFRISKEAFALCWKFRNDIISAEDFQMRTGTQVKDEKQARIDSTYTLTESYMETEALKNWTDNQIAQSREIYQNNKKEYLKKIKE